MAVSPEWHVIAYDIYIGSHDATQLMKARTRVHKMTSTESGNMPYDLPLCLGEPYNLQRRRRRRTCERRNRPLEIR